MLKYFARIKVYTCRKCGMSFQANSQPSGSCPRGGTHSFSITFIN